MKLWPGFFNHLSLAAKKDGRRAREPPVAGRKGIFWVRLRLTP
jgi:hypothetical protein